MKQYSARKMTKSEFLSNDDLVLRDAAGKLCHFAVEHESGATVTSLSWAQAVTLAETMNEREAVAA